jgi:hypothetical protein
VVSKIINVGSNPTTLEKPVVSILVKRSFCMRDLWVRVPPGPISDSLMVKQLAHDELIMGSSPVRGIFKIVIDGRVVECGGLLNHCTQVPGVRIPLYPINLCGGMVYTLDLKSSASAYGFKSHHR